MGLCTPRGCSRPAAQPPPWTSWVWFSLSQQVKYYYKSFHTLLLIKLYTSLLLPWSLYLYFQYTFILYYLLIIGLIKIDRKPNSKIVYKSNLFYVRQFYLIVASQFVIHVFYMQFDDFSFGLAFQISEFHKYLYIS